MAIVITDSTHYSDIADAIRRKNGEQTEYSPAEMADAISGLAGQAALGDGIVVTERNADGLPTSVDLYCSDGIIHAYTFGNSQNNSIYWMFKNLKSVNLKNRITRIDNGAFFNCLNLAAVTSDIDSNPFEYVESFNNNSQWNYSFANCGIAGDLSFPNYEATEGQIYQFFNSTAITALSCPKVTGVHQYFAYGCSSLKTVYLPKCATVAGNARSPFGNCAALESVQLGSIGTSCSVGANTSNNPFSGCTNPALVITIFSIGSSVDNSLTYTRNGATNATIIVKAAENTTYNGVSYAPGEIILTSTP